jgi:hypothetical protein
LNGLTAQVQYLQVGTSGTDFNISSSTATHTFNLPTASATNRGALSSADWTTFNNKQSTLSLTTTGNSGSATLVSNTLNVPTYTLAGLGGISLTSLSATTPLSYNNTTGAFSIQVANTSQDGYLSSTDWNTFNSKQSTITNPVTGTGTSGQVTYFNGTSSVTSSSNFKFDGTNLTIGNPSSALAQLHVFNSSAAATILLQTNSTTDYSEIAVRNNSSTATSYFRQYSTAATGSDFGISRAGLALFFSNYATNFAIGTRNGGDLILGTADTERVRINTSGNVGIGTSTFNGNNLLQVQGRVDANLDQGAFRLFTSAAAFAGGIGTGAWVEGSATTDIAIYSANNLKIYTGSSSTAKVTIASTGAATFSSSVTATSFIGEAATTEIRLKGGGYGGSYNTSLRSITGAVGVLQFGNNNDNYILAGNTAAGGYLIFRVNCTSESTASGIEAMRITSGGFLKQSNTSTYASPSIPVNEFNSDQNYPVIRITNSRSSGAEEMIRQDFSGYTPNNTSSWFIYSTDASAVRFYVSSNGGIANYQANDTNLSDERTKKDIIPLESYWDKFKAIEIVKFKYKDQTHDDFNIGVIAQQVESIAPEFVDIDGWNKPQLDEDGNEIINNEEPLMSVYTCDLHHATIKVLQEAMERIEEQQKQIEELKLKIK